RDGRAERRYMIAIWIRRSWGGGRGGGGRNRRRRRGRLAKRFVRRLVARFRDAKRVQPHQRESLLRQSVECTDTGFPNENNCSGRAAQYAARGKSSVRNLPRKCPKQAA